MLSLWVSTRTDAKTLKVKYKVLVWESSRLTKSVSKQQPDKHNFHGNQLSQQYMNCCERCLHLGPPQDINRDIYGKTLQSVRRRLGPVSKLQSSSAFREFAWHVLFIGLLFGYQSHTWIRITKFNPDWGSLMWAQIHATHSTLFL
jgi:hypothetical protein